MVSSISASPTITHTLAALVKQKLPKIISDSNLRIELLSCPTYLPTAVQELQKIIRFILNVGMQLHLVVTNWD